MRVDWPLPNVWLGTSVENQAAADDRIPHLLRTPAAVRWVSCEPLLGAVDISDHFYSGCHCNARSVGECFCFPRRLLHWVVAGGESGPKARPMHPEWARSLRDQCQEAGVPFHFKQWGEWAPARPGARGFPKHWSGQGWMHRFGKKAAGRRLDGRTWDEEPAGGRSS